MTNHPQSYLRSETEKLGNVSRSKFPSRPLEISFELAVVWLLIVLLIIASVVSGYLLWIKVG
jgi:hypothetical protein